MYDKNLWTEIETLLNRPVSRRKLLGSAAFVGAGSAAAWLLAACGGSGTSAAIPASAPAASSTASPTAASRKYPETARLGYIPASCQSSWIMIDTKMVERNLNVKTEWKLFTAGPAATQAFAQDQLDVAFIGVPPMMIGIDKGVPIKCVAATHAEGSVLVARKDSGLKTLAELKNDAVAAFRQLEGKTLGLPPKGSIQDAIARDYLRQAGLVDGTNVTVKNYDAVPSLPDILADGQIDAMVAWPPLEAKAVASGKAVMITPADALWPDNPCCALAMSQSLLKNYPNFAEDFLRQHVAASNFIMAYPEEAAEMTGRVMKMDKTLILESMQISPQFDALPDDQYVESSVKFAKSLYDSKYTTHLLTKDDIFDLTWIKKVHPQARYGGVGKVSKDPALYELVTGKKA